MTRKFGRLSDEALIQNTKEEVARERESTIAVIEYLEEIESRRLYSKYGYSTFWEFVVKELGYDSGSAQRRINAARISRVVPEVKAALTSSALCLTTISMIEQFTKNERKQGVKTYSAAEKKELLDQVAHKSTRETEAILKAISPDSVLPKEKQRVVNAKLVEVSFLADQETMALLCEMKRLLSGVKANPTTADAIKQALKLAVVQKSKKLAPRTDSKANATRQINAQHQNQSRTQSQKQDSSRSQSQSPTHSQPQPATSTNDTRCGTPPRRSPAGVESITQSRAGVAPVPRPVRRKYISVHKRRVVYHEANNQCTFVSSVTGKRCESRHQLEIEHIKPLAKNGSDDLENLTLLCKSHNLYNAVQHFGRCDLNRNQQTTGSPQRVFNN